MAVVNVNGSGQLSVDSQSKLVGLVSTWHSWLLLTYGFCENGCDHDDSTKKNYHSIFIRLHLLHHWDAVYCYWCRPVWGQTRGPRNCILEAEMTGCCSLAHPSNSVKALIWLVKTVLHFHWRVTVCVCTDAWALGREVFVVLWGRHW